MQMYTGKFYFKLTIIYILTSKLNLFLN